MRIFEMFAGYGTASFALKQLGIPYECVGFSEIDKYAIKCFQQNHCVEEKILGDESVFHPMNYGDATKINPNDLEDFDLLTGGFPCQAFSVAGKGLGELDTRGTLFNEIIRIAEVKKPRYMLLENVKGLTNKKHKPTFQKILGELRRIGYDVKWKVLNTKEHGIPQNRERVFFVCKLGEWNQTPPKIMSNGTLIPKFEFPQEEELKIFLKDILEEKVDEKYYLSDKQIEKITNSNFMQEKLRIQKGDVCSALLSQDYKDPKCVIEPIMLDVSQIRREGKPRIYEKISKTLNTAQGGGHTPLILQRPHGDNKGGLKAKDGICPALTSNAQWEHNNYLTESKMITLDKEGNKIKNTPDIGQAKRIYSPNGISPALNNWSPRTLQDFRIRKLTPKECFRLQGFLNDEVNLEGLSNTQRYKLAGNGQSVNVVKKIFERMFQ